MELPLKRGADAMEEASQASEESEAPLRDEDDWPPHARHEEEFEPQSEGPRRERSTSSLTSMGATESTEASHALLLLQHAPAGKLRVADPHVKRLLTPTLRSLLPAVNRLRETFFADESDLYPAFYASVKVPKRAAGLANHRKKRMEEFEWAREALLAAFGHDPSFQTHFARHLEGWSSKVAEEVGGGIDFEDGPGMPLDDSDGGGRRTEVDVYNDFLEQAKEFDEFNVQVGGRYATFDEQTQCWELYDKKDFMDLHLWRTYESRTVGGTPMSFITCWVQNYSGKRRYKSASVNPPPGDETVLNIFSGFAAAHHPLYDATEKEEEEQALFMCLDSILQLAGCNHSNATLLLKWLAHIFQRPFVKPNLCINFWGGKGTGKSSFCRMMYEMVGEAMSYMDKNPAENTFHHFNSCLDGKFLLLFEEASHELIKPFETQLRDLVTNDRISITYKHRNTTAAVPNYIRILSNTNQRSVYPAERRFVDLEGSNTYRPMDTGECRACRSGVTCDYCVRINRHHDERLQIFKCPKAHRTFHQYLLDVPDVPQTFRQDHITMSSARADSLMANQSNIEYFLGLVQQRVDEELQRDAGDEEVVLPQKQDFSFDELLVLWQEFNSDGHFSSRVKSGGTIAFLRLLLRSDETFRNIPFVRKHRPTIDGKRLYRHEVRLDLLRERREVVESAADMEEPASQDEGFAFWGDLRAHVRETVNARRDAASPTMEADESVQGGEEEEFTR